MIEKLYSLLFYASAEPEDLKSCRAEIQQSNKKKLISYLSISCVFLFALALLSLMSIGREVLWRNHFAYGIGLAVCIGLLLVAKVFPDKNGWLLIWEMYAFEAAIYVLGIYIGGKSCGGTISRMGSGWPSASVCCSSRKSSRTKTAGC